MLGHESAALTLDVYGALYEDDLTGLAEKIDSAAYSLRTGGESDQPRSASISR